MTEKERIEIFERANIFLNSLNYEEEMISIIDSLEEHEFCYSIGWCEKKELNINPENRRIYVGAGRVLVSKINDLVEYSGSAPYVDWVHEFELKIQNLEEYTIIEFFYSPKKISSIKTLLKLNTPELINKVNKESKIIIEGEDFELERLKRLLDKAEVPSKISLKRRKKTPTHNDMSKQKTNE